MWHWLLLGIILGSCSTSRWQYDSVTLENQYNLARVRKGMSQTQVLRIMNRPLNYESFAIGPNVYDVWFYAISDQPHIASEDLTPLTFQNEVLVGTDYDYYYSVIKTQIEEIKNQQPKNEIPQIRSAKNIESKNPLQQQKPPQSKNSEIPCNSCPPSPPLSEANCPCPQTICSPNRFSVLIKGVTEMQVYRKFGNPMKIETFTLCDDDYNVWFYDTIPSKSNKKSTVPQEQTVLIFKNAILISMNEEEFWDLKKMAKDAQRAANQPELNTITEQAFSDLRKGVSAEIVQEQLGQPNEQDTITHGCDVYHIWFYQVSTKKGTQTIPLTFKNGYLYGKTDREYQMIQNDE